MKKLLIAAVKLAMDAQYTDKDIARILQDAANAIGNGNFWKWSQGL